MDDKGKQITYSNMANTSMAETTTEFDVAINRDNCTNISAEQLNEFKIADVINLYVPPTLIIVGNLFNILALLVMRSHHFRYISTSIYMSACAVNDAVSLIISLTPHWLYVSFPGTIVRTPYSHYMCKFFNFYGYFNCDYTIVLTAVMTADRAFVVMCPIKASVADLVKRAKITIVVLMVMVVAKEFHFLIYSDIVPPERMDRLCDVVLKEQTYTYFFNTVWPWIHITFLTVCVLVIFVSNSIIIVNVRKSDNMGNADNSKHRCNFSDDVKSSRNLYSLCSNNTASSESASSQTTTGEDSNINESRFSESLQTKNLRFVRSSPNQPTTSSSELNEINSSQSSPRKFKSVVRGSTSSQSSSRSKWQQITVMLLAQSFALVILTYPFSTHLAISSHISDLYTDPEKKAANQLVFSVVFYLLYSNKCVNFCLYCITGSRFRHSLKELCLCKAATPQYTVHTMLKQTAIATSQTTLCSISLNEHR